MNSNKAHHKHTGIHTQTHLNHKEAGLLSNTVEAIFHTVHTTTSKVNKQQTNSKTGLSTPVQPSQNPSGKNKKPNLKNFVVILIFNFYFYPESRKDPM